MDINDYIALGDRLVATGKYEEASFAIVFMSGQQEKLEAEHFEKIGKWLENGIVNWGHTDVLSATVLSYFIIQKLVKPETFSGWNNSPSKWKRRAVPVTLIDVFKAGHSPEKLLNIIDPIMNDSDVFVQKGLGWFIREVWKKHPELAENFLMKWKETCGRTIVQYATEKMSKEKKSGFCPYKEIIKLFYQFIFISSLVC
ncbi:MAG: DNA alkylation repair protein [Bacteroidales bacterium]|nr:DNA alkylation repair protein [Bacteroidales bacterium]